MTTEEKILTAACYIFSERGFKETTVSDICEAAEANVAAVNYYFRSKEKLYLEVWRHAAAIYESKYPNTTPLNDPTAWLRTHIHSRIESVLDPELSGCLVRLIQKEMSLPSPVHEEIMSEVMIPRTQVLQSVVAAITGIPCDKRELQWATFSVISIYAMLTNSSATAKKHLFGVDNPSRDQIESMIDLMFTVIINGLKAISEKEKQ